MAYEKFYPEGWKDNEDGATPITAASLNHMEKGIIDNDTALSGKQPKITGTMGQIVGFDSDGNPIPQAPPDTGVTSFNGRSGAVTPQTGDYTPSQVGAAPASHVHSTATSAADGFISKDDKEKLDGIASGATKNTASSTTPEALGTATAGTETSYARGDHVHPKPSPTDLGAAPASHTHTAADVGAQKQALHGTVTIPTSGWGSDTTTAYPKYYDITVTGVTADDRASVDIAPASMSAAIACAMCPATETLAGKIRIRAASIPSAAIAANYWVEKGA